MRKSIFVCLLLTVCFFILVSKICWAADEIGEEIKLYLGENKVISVSNPTRIVIGNPEIADISNVGASAATLIPKSVGSTTFIVWDNYGEQSYRLRVFTEDTTELKKRVDNMLVTLNIPTLLTRGEDEEDKVVLFGSVKHAKDKERIATALAQVKDKIIDLVEVKEEEGIIEIDVQVLELYKGYEKKLGFEWPNQLSLAEVVGSTVGTSAVGTTSWGKLFQLGNINRNAFDLTLDLLINDGMARVLSRPRISCLSGKEAKLLVGGQVPVISGTTTAGPAGSTTASASGGSIEYKDYGIVLSVKPQIDDKGRVHLNLAVEVSELGDVVQTQNALAYTFTKRSATTELIINDGQTIGMGGLIKQRTDEELKKFPWLGDIPVLGVFFRHKDYSRGKAGESSNQDVELFITLTPKIVSQEKAPKELKTTPAILPSVSDDFIKDPVLKYSKMVQRKILEQLTYPAQAKEAGFQGTVKLSLNLSYQGDLLNLKLKESSNYRILDDNAISTAQRSGPYPPFPPTIKDKEIWVDIPVTYQLE